MNFQLGQVDPSDLVIHLSCVSGHDTFRYDFYEKAVTFKPYQVDMLDPVTANFLGDNLRCWMQIQVKVTDDGIKLLWRTKTAMIFR